MTASERVFACAVKSAKGSAAAGVLIAYVATNAEEANTAPATTYERMEGDDFDKFSPDDSTFICRQENHVLGAQEMQINYMITGIFACAAKRNH